MTESSMPQPLGIDEDMLFKSDAAIELLTTRVGLVHPCMS